MNSIKVFKDELLNQKIKEEGYVKIKLFSNDDCNTIKKMAKNLVTDRLHNKANFSTVPNPQTPDEKCLKVHSFFRKIYTQKISEFISEDYQFFYSTFLIKKNRADKLHWHIDPSFYNQKELEAPINIWGGVNNLTQKNGCLKIIPKSHKLCFDYEPMPLKEIGSTARCTSIKDTYNQLIEKHSVDIPLEKGEVIIHNQSLLHASHPNNSYLKKRIAFKIILIPKKVDKLELSYFNRTNNHLDIYQINKSEVSPNLCRYYNPETNSSVVNENDFVKNSVLNSDTLPYKTLAEMERIMELPHDSLKAKFELK
ncbi:conserved protein of unknown function [Tenacibaculum sp. 190130A14a]|uniref:Phytanoyl-CoA dioxygenase n=1 Tax=Tenacibaculum polynesiense TaxID=3137857 RepID=A0ABM9PB90_9FLAO